MAYIRRVSDYISIGPERELGDPANQDYLSMLKGFSLAMGE